MNFSRRTFISSIIASFALRAKPVWAAERPLLKFGVISDCHVGFEPSSTWALRKELSWFCREGVRVVVNCGDVCHDGTLAELKNVTDAWKDCFPANKNAQGETVVPIFVWGNHDYHDASYMRNKPLTEEDVRQAILCNKDKAWEMVTGERKHPGEVFLRKVCGATFIGAHWACSDEVLKPWLDAHRAEIPTDRPVFFVQHPHPRGTCFGKWRESSESGNSATLLEHPNFFVMSGHSHISNSFDDAIWQGGFVSMAAGAASGACLRGCEYNVGVSAKSPHGTVRHMPGADSGGSLQASIVMVYPSRVVVTRWDHRYGEHVGEDWDIAYPFVHDAKSPWRIAAAAAAPEFPAGAAVTVERKNGMIYPSKQTVPQIHFTFPAASSVGPHSRVVDYRVRIVRAADGVPVIERLVAQRGLSLTEHRARGFEGWCVFGVEELPRGEKLVATVIPINAGGASGKPIQKEFSL